MAPIWFDDLKGEVSSRGGVAILIRAGEAVLDFLYPPLCVVCHDPLSREERVVCNRCWAKVERWDGEVTLEASNLVRPVYAASLFKASDEEKKEDSSPMREIIHNLKYRNKKSLSRRLGEMMVDALGDDRDYDLVVPVPLHSARKRERGYNQSELLSRELADRLGLPLSEKILKRVKNTKSQTALEKAKRLENMKGAFRLSKDSAVFGKRILLVDDVTTTGATLEACAEALDTAGANKISAVVAAWAQ